MIYVSMKISGLLNLHTNATGVADIFIPSIFKYLLFLIFDILFFQVKKKVRKMMR